MFIEVNNSRNVRGVLRSCAQQPAWCATALWIALLFTGITPATFASVIDFESQCPSGVKPNGPCSTLFATVGNAQTLNIPTPIGVAAVSGGAVFDQITNLPADETALYGTAGNSANIGVFPGSGFTNPLTITFPVTITDFFLDVLNGNTISVDYHMADNKGNSADFVLAPNLSGGLKTIGFAATGSVVTISAATGQNTPGGMTWDFLIDNIHFNEPLANAAPEPGTIILLGAGLTALGFFRRTARS
jgi:hypothetical protein